MLSRTVSQAGTCCRAHNCDGPVPAQPELEMSHGQGQGPPPAAPADVQSRTSTLPPGAVQPTAVSLVEGQGGPSGSAQPVQEQEQPTAASGDSQGKGQVLGMGAVQEPAADSSRQPSNVALVSNAAKVEVAYPSQPAGSVQASDATEAGGSVATAAPAEAETAGSNLHQGAAGFAREVLAQSAIHLPNCGGDASMVQADLLQRYALTGPLCLPQ